MYDGIDVSVFQGAINWRDVRESGKRFSMIKATQGRDLRGKYYLFEDQNFKKNIKSATDAGLYCGSYHYLTAENESQARAEAAYYISKISPYRSRHLLWAAVDVEEDKYLPKTPAQLCAVVDAFCKEVNKAGFIPMVYTNPNYIRYKFRRVPDWDLWLAQWRDVKYGIPSGYPRLRIWQWGGGAVSGITGMCDSDIGTFWLPDQDFKPS